MKTETFPTYFQYTTSPLALLGKLLVTGIVVGMIVGRHTSGRISLHGVIWLSIATIAVTNAVYIGCTGANWIKRVLWWRKVGRVITWSRLQILVRADLRSYQIVYRSHHTGPVGFGTYRLVGGWASTLLCRDTGENWVVLGRWPKSADIPVPVVSFAQDNVEDYERALERDTTPGSNSSNKRCMNKE
jgi:hypothetical protein